MIRKTAIQGAMLSTPIIPAAGAQGELKDSGDWAAVFIFIAFGALIGAIVGAVKRFRNRAAKQ